MTFDECYNNNPTVHAILRAGRSMEDVVVALCEQRSAMLDRIAALELIAPKKITRPDGRVFVWRCPDDLIPDT